MYNPKRRRRVGYETQFVFPLAISLKKVGYKQGSLRNFMPFLKFRYVCCFQNTLPICSSQTFLPRAPPVSYWEVQHKYFYISSMLCTPKYVPERLDKQYQWSISLLISLARQGYLSIISLPDHFPKKESGHKLHLETCQEIPKVLHREDQNTSPIRLRPSCYAIQ